MQENVDFSEIALEGQRIKGRTAIIPNKAGEFAARAQRLSSSGGTERFS